jgi:hypothetical protein
MAVMRQAQRAVDRTLTATCSAEADRRFLVSANGKENGRFGSRRKLLV